MLILKKSGLTGVPSNPSSSSFATNAQASDRTPDGPHGEPALQTTTVIISVLLFLILLVIALLYCRHRKRQQRKREIVLFGERMISRLDNNQLPVSSTIMPTPILNRDPSFDRERMVPGPDEPSRRVARQPLHRQISYASESQATVSSIASTARQQSLRERAESMRGGISALEELLLNENVPEERRAARAELQQLRSAMAILSWMEQSDWARGLVDEPPPAYSILLGG